MAEERLVDIDGDNLSIPDDDDRQFDQESLSELELTDLPQQSGYNTEAFAQSSRSAQAAKALEIAEERSLPPSASTSPLPWDGHFAATSSRPFDASTSALNTAAAPPDYHAAIASDRAPSAVESSWTERMPQSMSDTGLLSQDRVERGEVYASPERFLASELRIVAVQLWRAFSEYIKSVRQKRGRNLGLTKRMVRFIVAALLVITLLSIFLPIIIGAIIRHREHEQWVREAHPFRDHPAYKRDPHKDHPSTEHCVFDVFSRYDDHSSGNLHPLNNAYRFEEIEDVTVELIDAIDTALPADFINPMVSGRVEIISIPSRNYWWDSQITLRSNVATTKPWQIEETGISVREGHEGHWTLQSPRITKGRVSPPEASEYSCLDVWIGLYIPVGMEIHNWTMSLRSLSFIDHRNYVFDPKIEIPHSEQIPNGPIKVANNTVIKSNQGSIDLNYWDSRATVLETRRGSISGKYSFYNSLDIKTLGGEVDIDVDPLGIALAHDSVRPLRLTTSTGSGNTSVTVLDPTAAGWTPHFMESLHRTTSGSMRLQYPSEWAGTIDGVTASDHVEVKGKDAHNNEDSLPALGEVHMMKGDLVSDWGGTLGRMDFESESGDVQLFIGEVP